MFGACQLSAQSPPINSINMQLRALFEDLDKPTPPLTFLYDMSAKMSDSVFYQTLNYTDTLQTDMWLKIYEEMFHAAYDTLDYTRPETVYSDANGFYSDTIPIGIMRYAYYKFKPDALTTDNYFDFDTVNTILTDKYPRSGWPYLNKALFVAAPSIATSGYSNPVFRIAPHFLFLDPQYTTYLNQGTWTLKIDFGDGFTVNLSHLPGGIYFIKIGNSVNIVSTKLIIVN